ncbi:MAG: hypothetical protein QNJ54_37400 [Prochloraceae cyanobacterium]|nr:hypothetical protein [Prochloraceae cyanobacterium]
MFPRVRQLILENYLSPFGAARKIWLGICFLHNLTSELPTVVEFSSWLTTQCIDPLRVIPEVNSFPTSFGSNLRIP